jgi:hypothetical protein
MRSLIKAATAASLTLMLGLLTPASAHTSVVIAPGQIIGGGYINTPTGPVQDPSEPSGPATDGTLSIVSLDPTVTSMKVRKCLDSACTNFEKDSQGNVRVRTHAISLGQDEVFLSQGFANHAGRYRVDTDGAIPAMGVFRVTGAH